MNNKWPDTRLLAIVIIIGIVVAVISMVYGVDYDDTLPAGYDYVPWKGGMVIYDTRDGTMWKKDGRMKRQIVNESGEPILYEGWGEK